jgi:hypothetical protein
MFMHYASIVCNSIITGMGTMQKFEVISENKFKLCRKYVPIPVAARSKARFHGRLFAGIADSNPAWGMSCLSIVNDVGCRTDHPCRGVLQSVVSLSLIVEPHRGGRGRLRAVYPSEKDET